MRYFEYPLGQANILEEVDSVQDSLNNQRKQQHYYLLKVDLENITGKKKIIAPIPSPKYNHLGHRIGVDWSLNNIKGEWYTRIDLEHAIKHGYKNNQDSRRVLLGRFWKYF